MGVRVPPFAPRNLKLLEKGSLKVECIEESTSFCHYDIEVPAELLTETYEKAVTNLRRSVRLPGFRKGKIPREVIRKRFHSDALNQAIEDLVVQTLETALKERETYPLIKPQITTHEADLGKPLRYRASFEVMPNIEAKDYRGLEVTNKKTEVTEDQVDAGLEHLREQHARFDPIENRGVSDRDFIIGELTATPTDGGRVEKFKTDLFEVGSDFYHPTLHEKIQNAEAGSELSFMATFPSDHSNTQWAGKTFETTFIVHELKEKVLPVADDEFAKDLGDFDTLDQVRTELRSQAEMRAQQNDDQYFRNELFDQLIAGNEFEVPNSLIDLEVRNRLQEIASDLQARGIDPNNPELDWQDFSVKQKPLAEKAVKTTILLDSIVKQEELKETEEAITEQIAQAAKAHDKSEKAIRAQMIKEGALERIRSSLRREKAVDFIKLHAKLK